MGVLIESGLTIRMELWSKTNGTSVPVYQEDIAGDLPDLLEETFAQCVLAGEFPNSPDTLCCSVAAHWAAEPFLSEIEVQIEAVHEGGVAHASRRFSSGRWCRRAVGIADRLRADGAIGEQETAYILLTAESEGGPIRVESPLLQPLPIHKGTLERSGVLSLGQGSLLPDRPVLVSARAVRDGIRLCREAGVKEAGAAVLGKLLEVPEPLPGTQTRIVTILSAVVADPRHAGEVGQVTFHPEALVEAETVAEMRGMGELVFSVLHTHGWSEACGACDRRDSCALPECTSVSAKDYTVMETLLSSKAALMPIVGRCRDADGDGPVLAVHAWRGGELRSIPWQTYED